MRALALAGRSPHLPRQWSTRTATAQAHMTMCGFVLTLVLAPEEFVNRRAHQRPRGAQCSGAHSHRARTCGRSRRPALTSARAAQIRAARGEYFEHHPRPQQLPPPRKARRAEMRAEMRAEISADAAVPGAGRTKSATTRSASRSATSPRSRTTSARRSPRCRRNPRPPARRPLAKASARHPLIPPPTRQMATKQIVGHLSPEDHTSLHPLLEGMAAALDLMTALKRKAIDIGKRQHGHMLTPERTTVDVREIVISKLTSLTKYMPRQTRAALRAPLTPRRRRARRHTSPLRGRRRWRSSTTCRTTSRAPS